MVGIQKFTEGRLGNKLFHYNLLRQIARKTSIPYFYPNFVENNCFLEMDKKIRPFKLFRKQRLFGLKEMLEYKQNKFLTEARCLNVKNIDIVLEPPMLGELFFDYLYYDPNKFIKICPQYFYEDIGKLSSKTLVGVHIRGTDFAEWIKRILNLSYYLAAIDYIERNVIDPYFFLFTDDFNDLVCQGVLSHFKEKSLLYKLGRNQTSPIYDLASMSQCDILISSSSTFAIWGGILGKQKKIIHSKKWISNRVASEDKFWVDLDITRNPYYSLWKKF